MRRTRWLMFLLVPLLLAGCNNGKPAHHAPAAATHRGSPICDVPRGSGVLGACIPKPPPTQRFGPALPPHPRNAAAAIYRGVDVSSYQSCRRWAVSFVIFKAYEFGYGPDRTASCEHNANSDKPTGPYFFARAGDPIGQADLAARTAKALGATGSLPGTLDYEVSAGGCSYIIRFGERYMADTGNRLFIVYSAQFIWPGCRMPSNFILWDAAYGPRFSNLATFAGGATMWQYSDGSVGPTPHLYGIDSDIFVRSSPYALVAGNHGAPPPPPKPVDMHKAVTRCAELNKFRARDKAQHGLHAYGRKRVAEDHHYFGKRHEGGKYRYVCHFAASSKLYGNHVERRAA